MVCCTLTRIRVSQGESVVAAIVLNNTSQQSPQRNLTGKTVVKTAIREAGFFLVRKLIQFQIHHPTRRKASLPLISVFAERKPKTVIRAAKSLLIRGGKGITNIRQLALLHGLARQCKSASLAKEVRERFVIGLREGGPSLLRGTAGANGVEGQPRGATDRELLFFATAIGKSLLNGYRFDEFTALIRFLVAEFSDDHPIVASVATLARDSQFPASAFPEGSPALSKITSGLGSLARVGSDPGLLDSNGRYLSRDAVRERAQTFKTYGERRRFIKFLAANRNFQAAVDVAGGLDLSQLEPADKVYLSGVLRKASLGDEADELLWGVLGELEAGHFDVKLIPAMCGALRAAGLGVPKARAMSEQFLVTILPLLEWNVSAVARLQTHHLDFFRYDLGVADVGPSGVATRLPESLGLLVNHSVESDNVFLVRRALPVLPSLRDEFEPEAILDFLRCQWELFSNHPQFSLSLLSHLTEPELVAVECDVERWAADRIHWPGMMNFALSASTEMSDTVQNVRSAARSFWGQSVGSVTRLQLSSPEVQSAVLGILLKQDLAGAARLARGLRLSDVFLTGRKATAAGHLLSSRFPRACSVSSEILRQDRGDGLAAAIYAMAARRSHGNELVIQRDLEKIDPSRRTHGLRGGNRFLQWRISRMVQGDHSRDVRPTGMERAQRRVFGGKFLGYGTYPDPNKARSVLVIPDAGVSDEVRVAQFYQQLELDFDKVIVVCDPRWLSLFKRSFKNISFLPFARKRQRDDARGEFLVGFGPWAENTLPKNILEYAAEVDVVTIDQNFMHQRLNAHRVGPSLAAGYLETSAGRRADGDGTQLGRLRVGIVWRSTIATGTRPADYTDLPDLTGLFQVPGIDYHCLQEELTLEETELLCRFGVQIHGVDFSDDFERTACLIESLDLVIGAPTLQLEIAAAVGVPVWLMAVSPEGYFLRTNGGSSDVDILTVNSTIIGPRDADFCKKKSQVVAEVVGEIHVRLLAVLSRNLSPPWGKKSGLRSGEE